MEAGASTCDAASRRVEFERLYNREFVVVMRYLRTAGGHADAEDLCSETFIRAFDAWARFRGDETAARYWLLRIAGNALIDQARRGARMRTVELPAQAVAPSTDDARRLTIEAALGRLARAELISSRFVPRA